RSSIALGEERTMEQDPVWPTKGGRGRRPSGVLNGTAGRMGQLEAILGPHFGRTFLQHSFERITYDSRTREVGVALVDGSQFGYTLPLARRPGVRRSFEEQQAHGRVPRVSRLMALALRFQDLLSHATVRNHAQLAELGHVSRVRVCQILMLNSLAPAIQQSLLFLPKTALGRDRITERRPRGIAKLV